MRIKGNSMFKFVVALGTCAFLLGVNGAGAVGIKQSPSKHPVKGGNHAAGPRSTTNSQPPFFLKDFTIQSYCESDCCWATGEEVSCSNSGCSGSDSYGTAIYICNAT
jgi:hypothetical protein